METQKIRLLGKEHAIVLPTFADREEVASAYTMAVQASDENLLIHYRAMGVALGLCTRIGRMMVEWQTANKKRVVTLANCKWDAMAYGSEVYGWLREQECATLEIAEAALTVQLACLESLYPRKEEVKAKQDFT